MTECRTCHEDDLRLSGYDFGGGEPVYEHADPTNNCPDPEPVIVNPLGIACVQCTPSDPCERCREQIKAEAEYVETP